MTSYSLILQKFNTEFRNGASFTGAPSDFSIDLKANVGEVVKLTQTIDISVTVNPLEIQTITYNATADATYGEFIGTGIDFLNEGLYADAVLHVTWGGNAPVSVTVQYVTGTGLNTIKVTKANLIAAGIVDGEIRTDFKFRLTSVPDTLIYKYGLNKNDYTGTSYTSWYDSNIQGYYISNLTTSLQTMTRIGTGVKSWDLSTIQAKFDSTSGTYFHRYTVEHVFKVPHYVVGEYGNIYDNTSPSRFSGTASIRYDNGWFFGGTKLGEFIKVELKGMPGNVGYFYESYNGYANNYLVQNVLISNIDNSGVLESSVLNTVTFQIKKNSAGNFSASSKVILYHSKLPIETEYQNKTTVWDTLWIYERQITTDTIGPVSGTIITNFEVTVNADPTILDVTAEIQYTTDQQALILNGSNYLLWVSVGYEGAINPDDRVAIPVSLGQFSKSLDVPGLITAAGSKFYEPYDSPYTNGMDTITGFDGDVLRAQLNITKLSNPVGAKAEISVSKVEFKIITTDGDQEGELLNVNIPLGSLQFVNVAGYRHQILNSNVPGALNMPQSLSINRLQAFCTIPVGASPTQDIEFTIGFQTPWRDWIVNNSIPNELYNVALPNNNKNFKTSNYSNASGFEIFAVWDVTIKVGDVETIYRKETFESLITDFDTSGSAGFSAAISYFTSSGQVYNLFNNENVLIVAEFTHALGTITKANIEGYIWIERDGSSEEPFYLHTSLDTNMPNSPLTPSNTLALGNTTFVEYSSTNNKVTLFCYTNKNNIQDGVNYNVYARIKNKTVL